MTIENLLSELYERQIVLSLDGEHLGVRAPKGAMTEDLRLSISVHKEDLLALMRSQAHRVQLPKITPHPQARYEPFPLLDVQHAYSIGRRSLVESGGVSTHLYVEYEQAGLDIERLTASLRTLIARHDMLRAVFLPDGRQCVLEQVPPYRIETEDLCALTTTEIRSRIDAVRRRLSHQVLPSDRWPLFEFRALLLEGGRVRLCFSIDMLIMDGGSFFLLREEWARLYSDPSYQPPPLELTFRDYVLAQGALEEGEAYRCSRNYWIDRIDRLPPAPDLPVAGRPPRQGSPNFVRHYGTLAKVHWERLKGKAVQRGITPTVLLAACFGEVLRRWAKEPDFTLNVTLFNRLPMHPQVDQIIGEFASVNLLEMRTMSGETFETRARRHQRQLSEDLEHVHFSGIRVLRERARRIGGGLGADMPVVFTSVIGLTGEGYDATAQRVFGEWVYGISQTPQVWIDHQVHEHDGDLIYHWDVVEDLYPNGMVADMFGSFSEHVRRLVDDDSLWTQTGCVAALPRWQDELLAKVNATDVDLPVATLHELVAAQVRRRPDAPAVLAENGSLSYAELSAHAHRIGRWLRNHGAVPNRLVALSMEKGWEQVAAVLGVLHSGAAYLPIDPELPQARRWQLLSHGEADIVLTQAHLRDLPWPAGTTVVTLDNPSLVSTDAAPIDFVQTPDDLAYVLFTSGSTGEPKAAMNRHRGIVNTVLDLNRRHGVDERDRALALAALNFDFSVYDIFGVLAAGGAIVMPAARAVRDPAHWQGLIERHHVTLWNSVPQLLQMYVEYLQATGGSSGGTLRHAQLGGDWIPLRLPDQARAVCRGLQLVSIGGPTEASFCQVAYPIGETDPAWSSIPYGKPLANQHLYVLNTLLEERAVDAIGEIFVGGVGVGLGYWGDQARTAERFIIHPQTGEHLYRTGDLARLRADGNLEILGREDFQVKINGYRIELGEVEAELRRQPGVQESVVKAAVNPNNGHKQLVAYIVARNDEDGDLFEESSVSDPRVVELRRQEIADVLEFGLEDHQLLQARHLQTFDDTWGKWETIALDVIACTLAEIGVFCEAGEVADPASIVSRCALPDRRRPLLRFWLDLLTQDGRLHKTQNGSWSCVEAFDLEALRRSVDEAIRSLPAEDRMESSFLVQCARSQTALLKGERSALDLMFPGGGAEVAYEQHERNPVSVVQNKMAADVMRTVVERQSDGDRLNVLEVGAGMGCSAASLLPLLPPERSRYCYTDLSTFFTGHGKQRFAEYRFVEYGLLNIDRNPQPQGYEPHSFDVIVSSNTLHLVRDTGISLGLLRSLLAPSGVLLMIENTFNSPVEAISVGLLDDFGNYDDERRNTELPLLTAAQWQHQLEAAGFSHVCASAPMSLIRHGFKQHVIVAEAAARIQRFRTEALRLALGRLLPDYMVPHHYILLDKLPVNANGKIDLKALPEPWSGTERTAFTVVEPRNETEQRLYAIWKEALGRDGFGAEGNFFELGGDSLIAVSVINRLHAEFDLAGVDQADVMQHLFANPTIAAMADFIARQDVTFEI
jgi:pyochelin synthetase